MISLLLQNVKNLVLKEKEIKKIKGEDFNIFNILGMQADEVKTHSSFIAELLNPKGTHYMDDVFLKIFIETIKPLINFIPDTNVEVKVEKNLGKINNQDNTGGRIDIFLRDAYNNTIAIENKIYADDQLKQLVRYKNFKTKNHSVIYLTLYGKDPDEKSIKIDDKNTLKEGEDYQKISYKNHITAWLKKCEEKATAKPILRESIKQYRILIDQLTNNMENEGNIELERAILDNIEAAKKIVDNYEIAIRKVKEDFRNKVLYKLKQKLTGYHCEPGNEINSKYAQIWIKPDYKTLDNLQFGVETFSGNIKAHQNGVLFVGIFNKTGNISPALEQRIDADAKLNKWWPQYQKLKYDNKDIVLSNPVLLQTINQDQDDKIVNSIVDQILNFIQLNKNTIKL